MRFRVTLELAGKTATGFRVPPEVIETRERRVAKALDMLRAGRKR